jgi:hypothetical protein
MKRVVVVVEWSDERQKDDECAGEGHERVRQKRDGGGGEGRRDGRDATP